MGNSKMLLQFIGFFWLSIEVQIVQININKWYEKNKNVTMKTLILLNIFLNILLLIMYLFINYCMLVAGRLWVL